MRGWLILAMTIALLLLGWAGLSMRRVHDSASCEHCLLNNQMVSGVEFVRSVSDAVCEGATLDEAIESARAGVGAHDRLWLLRVEVSDDLERWRNASAVCGGDTVPRRDQALLVGRDAENEIVMMIMGDRSAHAGPPSSGVVSGSFRVIPR